MPRRGEPLLFSRADRYRLTFSLAVAIILRSKFMEAYRSGHNEAVMKTVWAQAHGGSNPSASAKAKIPPESGGIFALDMKRAKRTRHARKRQNEE